MEGKKEPTEDEGQQEEERAKRKAALTQNRTMDLQIFSLTLFQLSYQGAFEQ
jgi:hypothetical protein